MKCFFHNDFDGHASGAIVKHRHPNCEMIKINYGYAFPWESIEKGELVYMVDFGLQPFTDMIRLNSVCSLIWIDHHKTAIEDAAKNNFQASKEQVLEIGKAGCELTWEYLYESNPPLSVYLLGRYDVWDHTAFDAIHKNAVLQFQYGMRQFENTMPDNQELWGPLFTSDDAVRKIIIDGRILLEYETLQNAKFCKSYAFETEFCGLKAICANKGFTSSQVFDSVYGPEHDLMITFVRSKPPIGKWNVGVYSDKEHIDCGQLAKQYGGGGHKGAGGFSCVELPFSI